MNRSHARRLAGRAAILAVLAASLTLRGAESRRDSFEAIVVAVHDGDTISVHEAGRTTRVRLAGIDCPEARQPFAARAKRFTSDMAFGRTVRVEAHGVDRYDRLLARILVDGTDVNAAIVRAGLAWSYPFGSPDPALESAERSARAARVGLWSDPSPIPPWTWRRMHRK